MFDMFGRGGGGGGRGGGGFHGGGFHPGGGHFHPGVRVVRGGGWGGWGPWWDGGYLAWPWWPYVSALPVTDPLRAAFEAWRQAAASNASTGFPTAGEVARLRRAFVALLHASGHAF